MKHFKLVIEYDGTNYNGWQIQASGRTVQGEIEAALSRMTRQHVRVIASGRTDAGVHALGQVATFKCRTSLTPDVFFSGLNSLLPNNIAIRACEAAPDDFHPRFDAIGKTYMYRILNHPLRAAIGRKYFWHIRKKLCIPSMEMAVAHIIGTHDFKSFENTGSPRSHTTRTVTTAFIGRGDTGIPCLGHTPAANDIITIQITANGFLRYMVRNLVATLVDVGLSRLTPGDFRAIMNKKDRAFASATAPPQGLFLVAVQYADNK